MPKDILGILLYTLAELAERFTVSLASLRTYISRGELKARKIGNQYYVAEASLKEYFGCPADAPLNLLTAREVAKKLEVRRRAIIEYCNINRLKGRRMGNEWYIRVEDLRAFILGSDDGVSHGSPEMTENPPFGYRRDEVGNLVHDEQEQEIISSIRRLRAEGLSYQEITNELATRGMRTKEEEQ